MSTIQVKPAQLRSIADQITAKARLIHSAVNSIDKNVNSLNEITFTGNRAVSLKMQFSKLRPELDSASTLLKNFAQELENCADIFEEADKFNHAKSVSNPGLNPPTSNLFYWVRGNIVSYTLEDVKNYLLRSNAGKNLLKQAETAGICFVIQPDGTILGDPKGIRVGIQFGSTEKGTLGYQLDNRIVISDSLTGENKGVDTMSDILGHEMQHAIDRKEGVLLDYSGHENITDKIELEKFLEDRTETRISSEVRAWERGNAILSDSQYQDDGITSSAERSNILLDKGYEQIYENQLNEEFAGQYTADCWINGDGKLEITLNPIEDIVPIIGYA